MKKLFLTFWILILLVITAFADITTLPTPPQRSDPATFSTRADAFLGVLPTFGAEANALAVEVNGYKTDAEAAEASALAAQAVAQSSANFKGNWSDQTGAAAIPYSVYHEGNYWQLVSNLADVTASEPGVTAAWKVIGSVILADDLDQLHSFSVVEGAVVYLKGRAISGDGGKGVFVGKAGDFTAEVTADTLSGIYAPSNADSDGSDGCWIRQFDGPVQFAWFCKFDGVYDDTVGMQSAINLGYASYEAQEGVCKLSDEISITRPIKLIGQGNIASATMNLKGTLFWQTDASKSVFKFSGPNQDSYIANFSIVSEGDGLWFYQSHRNTVLDVHAVGGMVGNAFVFEGSYENRVVACTATTNGYSAQSYTTGYVGRMTGGFILKKGAASYGANATELHGCIASGCDYGVWIGGASNTYANVFGGTFEGNNVNITIDTAGKVVVYGTHVESPITYNAQIIDSDGVKFDGVSFGGIGSSGGVSIESSVGTLIRDTDLGYASIGSNSINTIIDNCKYYLFNMVDYGINTKFINPISFSDYMKVDMSFNDISCTNVLLDAQFDRWVSTSVPAEHIAQTSTLTRESTIVKLGSYSCLITNPTAGTYSGLIYSDLGSKLASDYVTIGYWQYVPTGGNLGLFGVRVYGLDGSAIIWTTPDANELDKWVWKSYSVFVGTPGSTRRTGSINVAIVVSGGNSGGAAYIDGVTIVDGRTIANKGTPSYNNGISAIIDGHKVIYDTAAPVSGSYIIGDRCFNSAPAVGQPKAWTCTVTGSPGTWVSEGNL